MPYITNKSILINERDFFVGSNSYDSTTTHSNEVKITASDAAANDFFGRSVSVGLGRIVVGAYGKGFGTGSIFIFDLDGNELAKLDAVSNDIPGGGLFGISTSLGSRRIVVGTPKSNDDGTFSGSAYIFDLDGNELGKITASDAAANDYFGWSVAIGSGRIVVGSPLDADNGADSGSAYIFDLDGNQLAKITASDGAIGDNFGISVAIGSGRIVVGAYQDADNGTDSGSAYIFDLDGNQLAKITASDGAIGDNFGRAIAVGSGRIVVGAYFDDNSNGTDSGSAYIFDLDGNQLAKILPSDGAAGDIFGFGVAVGSGRIVVGAYGENNGSSPGSAYIYDLDGNELAKITASDGATDDYFGISVAVGSDRIVVGADGDDDAGNASGSAYIYTMPNQKHYLDQLD